MSKKQGNKDNFRVVVDPRAMTDFGGIRTSRDMFYSRDAEGQRRWERDMQDRCEEIIADIKRHVDSVSSAWVEFDQEHVCEHCGWQWTGDNDNFNDGCCEADLAAEEERQAKAAEKAS